ncbi:hypothetical protein [Exiguobacterium sp. s22]|uniref:hypothetical protein n=1 Tax=Exiguobacterium sp. s22 TaxID=2751272 RepID=UPI001BE75F31|nr:hypothetical protein [Exiguobacterium sp. s22]
MKWAIKTFQRLSQEMEAMDCIFRYVGIASTRSSWLPDNFGQSVCVCKHIQMRVVADAR